RRDGVSYPAPDTPHPFRRRLFLSGFRSDRVWFRVQASGMNVAVLTHHLQESPDHFTANPLRLMFFTQSVFKFFVVPSSINCVIKFSRHSIPSSPPRAWPP